MQYYSLNKISPDTDFKAATLLGQAPDKGLYFPRVIPTFEKSFIDQLHSLSNEEIAYTVIAPYVGETIPEIELRRIVAETLAFPIPLQKVTEDIYSLELFHGPTLAFKDVGARFMSRCLGYFAKNISQRVVVLVATSGDTGGAVAHGFYNVPGIDVVILYPSGKVSPVQEKQLTTLGNNIHALEVQGNFDDCQRMVKMAFADAELTSKMFLTSANSINVARWLPQQFYYLLAIKQWQSNHPPVISVPSGNFGNICAGLLAQHSGLPVDHFIASVNVNDVVPRFFESGEYEPRPAYATISNAMDVGDPSNFIRIREIFSQVFDNLKKNLTSESFTDEQTKGGIATLYKDHQYMADPHGAVGYLGLKKYLAKNPGKKGIFLETAHPVKFPDSVESIIGKTIPVPEQVAHIMNQEKRVILIAADYQEMKANLAKIFA